MGSSITVAPSANALLSSSDVQEAVAPPGDAAALVAQREVPLDAVLESVALGAEGAMVGEPELSQQNHFPSEHWATALRWNALSNRSSHRRERSTTPRG